MNVHIHLKLSELKKYNVFHLGAFAHGYICIIKRTKYHTSGVPAFSMFSTSYKF